MGFPETEGVEEARPGRRRQVRVLRDGGGREDGQTVPSAPMILLLTADRSGKGPAVFGPDGPTVSWPRAQPGAP